jgi:hypothetical protein
LPELRPNSIGTSRRRNLRRVRVASPELMRSRIRSRILRRLAAQVEELQVPKARGQTLRSVQAPAPSAPPKTRIKPTKKRCSPKPR